MSKRKNHSPVFNACTCTPSRPAQKPERASGNGSIFTTDADPTAAWEDCRRIGAMNKAF